jgi:hypothetical protein
MPVKTFLKWLAIGVGFGIGASLTLVGALAVQSWYASRPKPWNKDAITAQLTDARPSSPDGHISLWYSFRNNTDRDITLTEGDTIAMVRLLKQSSSLQTDHIKIDLPLFIPAGHSIIGILHLLMYKLPVDKELNDENAMTQVRSYTNFAGFTVMVPSLRYEVTLPGPASATVKK